MTAFSDELRISSIFIVLLSSVLGVSLPLLAFMSPKVLAGRAFSVARGFGTGVILTTAFVHILPEGSADLDNTGIDFPLGGTVALSAIMAMFFLELLIKAFTTSPNGRQAAEVHAGSKFAVEMPAADFADTVGAEEEGRAPVPCELGHSHLPPSLQASDSMGAAVMVHVLELGIIVHSVAIGITLGLATGRDDALPLMVAICFHQFFEGIGLGSAFVNANFSPSRSFAFATLFAFTTPFGVALGYGFDSRIDEGSMTFFWTSGIVNCFSAGLLIYFGLVNMLVAEFNRPSVRENYRLQLAMGIGTMLGFLSMVLLAMWA
ncbi:Zinc/iron permease [Pavlovales sp. CCMP2436]|nr:Zinc/iron permease [Pavlovales sp. CCMP2436]